MEMWIAQFSFNSTQFDEGIGKQGKKVIQTRV